jgi:CRISP-associated protein Cas1
MAHSDEQGSPKSGSGLTASSSSEALSRGPDEAHAKALPLDPLAARLTQQRLGALGDDGAEIPTVPARMVNEVLYCERLMYLEWIQGEWASNRFTADGDRVHKRVDAGKQRLKPRGQPGSANENAAKPAEPEEKPYQARSVWLTSEKLGLTAKLDVVDVEGGKALAVEFKRGKRPKIPEGAYLPERAQLCAHVLLLREHGYVCDEGEIYFAGDRQRTRIAITEELIATTLQAIARVRELASGRQLPPPLENSPKCGGCSLNVICLPDEVAYLRAKRLPLWTPKKPEKFVPDPEDDDDDLFDEKDGSAANTEKIDEIEATETVATETAKEAPRRLVPTRDDRVPLYVSTQGASVHLDGEQLTIFADGEKQAEARLPNTSHLALFGNVQISTQALRSLLGRGIAVHFYSYGAWWVGACTGADSNNVELRLAQYRATQDPKQCLHFAQRWVRSKIKNCRTLLRRNHRAADPVVLNELKFLANKALTVDAMESLLGIEGTAARTYFQSFTGMLSDASLAAGFSLEGRNRRPPRDRVNALLSLAYSLLSKDCIAACRSAGLDPLLGFYHQPRFGRPSLALDLMEEFRPIVADSVVLSALNNGVVQFDDFVDVVGSVSLSDRGRKRFIQTYEQRMDQEIVHPVFGYRVSYRRVLEVQARLLGRALLGEIEEVPSFRTR